MIPPPSHAVRRWVCIDVHSYMHYTPRLLTACDERALQLCSSTATIRWRAMCSSSSAFVRAAWLRHLTAVKS